MVFLRPFYASCPCLDWFIFSTWCLPKWYLDGNQVQDKHVHAWCVIFSALRMMLETEASSFSFRLQFLSHAGICHIAVHWQYNEVLLFSDPAHVGLEDPQTFRTSTALEHHRKNIQLGLRIGQAALISFTVDGQHMKAIWILMNNKLPSSKGGNDPATRNPFWKSTLRGFPPVLLTLSVLKHLLPFLRLSMQTPWSYHNLEDFEGPGNTKRGFGIPATLHGLTPLGDTRNSQELAVFCNMPMERLRVTCGLAQEDFFFLAGCNRSLGYRQSRLKRRKDTRSTKT